MKDGKITLKNNYLQVLLREKLKSRLIVQNVQINLMLLIMAMLMMTMIIINPGKNAQGLFYFITSSGTSS